MKDLKTGQLDQITAKAYLDKNVFGLLEESLNSLLETIERNGEFERYVEMLAERQEREERELRRRNREMQRLVQGDHYDGSDDSERESEVESKTSDNETEEDVHQLSAVAESVGQASPGLGSRQHHEGEIGEGLVPADGIVDMDGVAVNAQQMSVVNEAFNPLRFIAMHLKELNAKNK